jgi:hypothetical protein
MSFGPSIVFATEDDEIKKGLANGKVIVKIGERTRDACDRANNITITSTTDGDVILKPGEEKYFQIKKTDDYTMSGGWYWKCGNSLERSRIKGATHIKAVRSERGVTDWYVVTIERRQ